MRPLARPNHRPDDLLPDGPLGPYAVTERLHAAATAQVFRFAFRTLDPALLRHRGFVLSLLARLVPPQRSDR